jgi:transposase
MAADGVSQREIAARLGINRRIVRRMLAADEPPRYSRAPQGSMLDPLEPVLRRLLEEWPAIKAARVTEILRAEYGYVGSVDLVRRRLQRLRRPSGRPAQRTGYRPGQVLELDWAELGQVLQLDWAELPTRPRIAGRERRVYALVGSLPFSGAQSAHFSFDMTLESFLEGDMRLFNSLLSSTRSSNASVASITCAMKSLTHHSNAALTCQEEGALEPCLCFAATAVHRRPSARP